jgi:hypothetical protein
VSEKARWQQISRRRWGDISPVWIDVAATIPDLVAKPDPGLEKLQGLLALGNEPLKLYEDVPGLRMQVFWDAAYLYAKCDHAKIAAERLANIGMASWAMFNAYHSAYLGARCMLWLLGVPLPDLAGRQVFLDLFPGEDPTAKKRRGGRPLVYQEFLLKNIGKLDQRALWGCLQRVMRISTVECWDSDLVDKICRIDETSLTPPRNHFLYKAGYWIFDDLIKDMPNGYEWMIVSEPVSTSDRSFLLWLCFAIHRLLTNLFRDLTRSSSLIATCIDATRTQMAANSDVEASYRNFCEEK